MKHARLVSTIAALALAGLALSGCGQTQATPPAAKLASSLEELFAQWLDSPDATAHDKVVLQEAIEAGQITQAQYQEALDLYITCMSDAGYELQQTRYSTGIINAQPPSRVEDLDALIATDQLCQEQTSVFVVMGYETQLGNPDLYADAGTVAYTCLRKNGLIEDDVALEQVAAFLTESHRNQYPFDVQDLDVKSCFYAAGMTYDIDETA